MIKSAVTLNLIDSMNQGPWIFWYDLEGSLMKAAELGFDGVELFTRSGIIGSKGRMEARIT